MNRVLPPSINFHYSNTRSDSRSVRNKQVEPSPSMPYFDPVTVATFNTAGYHVGGKTVDDVLNLRDKADIIGLQEVYSKQMHDIAAAMWNTHEPYVGQGYHGGYNGEFSPIFYNKNRFEAVYTETAWLHGANFKGKGGPPRIANYLILKEKTTGATMLVVNTHWADNIEGNGEANRLIDAKVRSLKQIYPIDNITIMGDFNAIQNGGIQFYDESVTAGMFYIASIKTYEGSDGKHNIDMIFTDADKADEYHTVTNGGESDHNIVMRTLKFRPRFDGSQKNNLLPANQGGMIFEDGDYGGDEWFFGLGTTGPINNGWNDKVSSIRLEDSTAAEVSNHSENDSKNDGPDDYKRELTGDTNLVGDFFDNIISHIILWRK